MQKHSKMRRSSVRSLLPRNQEEITGIVICLTILIAGAVFLGVALWHIILNMG